MRQRQSEDELYTLRMRRVMEIGCRLSMISDRIRCPRELRDGLSSGRRNEGRFNLKAKEGDALIS